MLFATVLMWFEASSSVFDPIQGLMVSSDTHHSLVGFRMANVARRVVARRFSDGFTGSTCVPSCFSSSVRISWASKCCWKPWTGVDLQTTLTLFRIGLLFAITSVAGTTSVAPVVSHCQDGNMLIRLLAKLLQAHERQYRV